MDGKILMAKEAGMQVYYYEKNGKIHRVPYYYLSKAYPEVENIDDVLDMIVENPREEDLKNVRERYIRETLNGDLSNSLRDPLDDDVICLDIFKELLDKNGDFSASTFRRRQDKIARPTIISEETAINLRVEIFRNLILQYRELRKVSEKFNLSEDTIKELEGHVNDRNFLAELVKIFYSYQKNELLFAYDKTEKEAIQKRRPDAKIFCLKEEDPNNPALVLFNKKELEDLLVFYKSFVGISEEDHVGAFSASSAYETRIYLNIHDMEVAEKFLTLYVNQCIANKMEYNMKGCEGVNTANKNDAIVLYSKNSDLRKRIGFIEQILLEHPEFRESFEPPIYGTSRVGTGVIGIASHPKNVGFTGRQYIEHIYECAYYSLLAKALIDLNIVKSGEEYWDMFRAVADLKDLVTDKRDPYCLTMNGECAFSKAFRDFFKFYLKDEENYLSIKNKIASYGASGFRERAYRLHALCQGFTSDKRVDIGVDRELLKELQRQETISEEKPKIRIVNSNNNRSNEAPPVPVWRKKTTPAESEEKPKIRIVNRGNEAPPVSIFLRRAQMPAGSVRTISDEGPQITIVDKKKEVPAEKVETVVDSTPEVKPSSERNFNLPLGSNTERKIEETKPEAIPEEVKTVPKVEKIDQLRREARKLLERLRDIRNNIFLSDNLKGKFGPELIRLANSLTDAINKREVERLVGISDDLLNLEKAVAEEQKGHGSK